MTTLSSLERAASPSTDSASKFQNFYSFHDSTATVTMCGGICNNRRKINLSHVFAGQKVGVRQVSDPIWLVSFMQYELGYFEHETCRLEPIENPFGPKVLPMCRAAYDQMRARGVEFTHAIRRGTGGR